MDVHDVAAIAVSLDVARLAHFLAALRGDGTMLPLEIGRVRHLHAMASATKRRLVAGRALRARIASQGGMLDAQLRIVRQTYAMALVARSLNVTGGACVHVTHAVRLLPLRPMRDGPRAADEPLFRPPTLVTRVALDDAPLLAVAAQTALHLVAPSPSRALPVRGAGVTI